MGLHLTERVEYARGTPENPMTRDEVVAKASGLMTPVLGAEDIEEIDRPFCLISIASRISGIFVPCCNADN